MAARDDTALDRTFQVSVLLKGADGVLELIGGVLLLVVAPSTISHLVRTLTQHELSRDPHDFVATHLLRATGQLRGTQLFGAIYLLSHGLIKIVLVVGLLTRQRWAYPASIAFLGAFIAYQLYRLTTRFSWGLVALTVFDAVVVWLIWREGRATGELGHRTVDRRVGAGAD